MYIVISGPLSLKDDKEKLKQIELMIKPETPTEMETAELKTRYQILYRLSWENRYVVSRKLDLIEGIKYYETWSKPKAFWSEEEKEARAVQEKKRQKQKKENEKKQEVTAKVVVRQTIELYKSSAIGGDRRFYILFRNKKLRKAFKFIELCGKWTWRKASWPGLNTLRACSPLEFTTLTGTSFVKQMREQFGVEVVNSE